MVQTILILIASSFAIASPVDLTTKWVETPEMTMSGFERNFCLEYMNIQIDGMDANQMYFESTNRLQGICDLYIERNLMQTTLSKVSDGDFCSPVAYKGTSFYGHMNLPITITYNDYSEMACEIMLPFIYEIELEHEGQVFKNFYPVEGQW